MSKLPHKYLNKGRYKNINDIINKYLEINTINNEFLVLLRIMTITYFEILEIKNLVISNLCIGKIKFLERIKYLFKLNILIYLNKKEFFSLLRVIISSLIVCKFDNTYNNSFFENLVIILSIGNIYFINIK